MASASLAQAQIALPLGMARLGRGEPRPGALPVAVSRQCGHRRSRAKDGQAQGENSSVVNMVASRFRSRAPIAWYGRESEAAFMVM
jgi:hypothetical protein